MVDPTRPTNIGKHWSRRRSKFLMTPTPAGTKSSPSQSNTWREVESKGFDNARGLRRERAARQKIQIAAAQVEFHRAFGTNESTRISMCLQIVLDHSLDCRNVLRSCLPRLLRNTLEVVGNPRGFGDMGWPKLLSDVALINGARTKTWSLALTSGCSSGGRGCSQKARLRRSQSGPLLLTARRWPNEQRARR